MVKISIDKLSFTGRIDTALYTDMLDYLEVTPFENEYRHMPWNFLYQHQWNFKRESIFIQIGTYEKERVFRMEFNPNNLQKACEEDKTNTTMKFFYDIVKRVKMPNVTRIDWAVDYEKDLSNCKFELRIPRKKEMYLSRSDKLETLYLGSKQSDKFIRIYNKLLEMIKKKKKIVEDLEEEIELEENLWRVESVVKDFQIYVEQEIKTVKGVSKGNKGKEEVAQGLGEMVKEKRKIGYDYLFDNPFKTLAIYEKYENIEGKQDLKWQEKAALEYFENHPEEFEDLPANTKKKYLQLKYAYGYRLIENQPAEVFEKEKNRLANEVESLLKPALDNTRNITGDLSNVHYSIEFLKYLENGKQLEKKPFKLNNAEIYYEKTKDKFSLKDYREWIEKLEGK